MKTALTFLIIWAACLSALTAIRWYQRSDLWRSDLVLVVVVSAVAVIIWAQSR